MGNSSPMVELAELPSAPAMCTGVAGGANSLKSWRQPPQGEQGALPLPITTISAMRCSPAAIIAATAERSAQRPCG
jgi:hypothetical protein